jgi:hypothetical protein
VDKRIYYPDSESTILCKGCVFNVEAANTNLIVFGLTHPVMSITITQPTQTLLTALK